ncbi:MAG: SURF1 family protein [Pseudomonadota bacterium]
MSRQPTDRQRALWVDVSLLAFAGLIFIVLISLGNWQVRRLAWKLDLIESVNARAFGEAQALPPGNTPIDEITFLRVETVGTFDHGASRKVKAVTELGPGYWLMTPLSTGDAVVWVNRGFVPTGTTAEDWTNPEGRVEVRGLVRSTEPNGTILEKNDPDKDRWYSRDVDALSNHVSVKGALPYFIDAEASGETSWPRGGLTRTSFSNTHLAYAITWYGMAALLFAAVARIVILRFRAKLAP